MYRLLLFFISTLILFIHPVLAYTTDGTFYSCTTAAYGKAGTAVTGASSATTCASVCKGKSYLYSSYLSGSTCTCSNTNAIQTQWANGDSGACASGTYESWVASTSFDFGWCGTFSGLKPVSGSSADLETIFKACAGYPYIQVIPSTSSSVFTYGCGSQKTGQTTASCTTTNWRIYSHPADAVASKAARRRRDIEIGEMAQGKLASPHCPTGLTPCLISAELRSGYECIDTSSELESCGGCVYGVYGQANATSSTTALGQDCSSIPNVALGGSTCTNGQCHFSCRKGYSVESGECVQDEEGQDQTSRQTKTQKAPKGHRKGNSRRKHMYR